MRDGVNTRQRLERCALKLFVEKGVTGTTIKDIAHLAKVAEGTLYRHYASKEDLAYHLFASAYHEVSSYLKELSQIFSTLDQKISGMVCYFCEKYDEDSILFTYLLLSQHNRYNIIHENEISAHELLVSVFQDAIDKKEVIQREPQFYAAIVLGIVLQAAMSRVYGRITRTMTQDSEDLVNAIYGAIRC